MRRVILIHGWMGSPHGDWFPWLIQELKRNDFLVLAPAMLDPSHPRIQPWVREVRQAVGQPDGETYLVGHSVGGQAILRYLETIEEAVVGGTVLVAPWLSLAQGALETKEDEVIAAPWLETPILFEKAKQAAGSITAIFSDNDPWVPLSNASIMREKLGAKIIIEKGKGHFSEDVGGVTELPEGLREILMMANVS